MSLFVRPTQEQLACWSRTTIKTTKPGQIILFADSVIHEISRLGKNSISLFLSPYRHIKATTAAAGMCVEVVAQWLVERPRTMRIYFA